MKYALGKCVMCAGPTEVRQVKHVVLVDPDVVVALVEAEVCRSCGHRAFDGETIEMFERICRQIRKGDLSGLKPMGRTFSVA